MQVALKGPPAHNFHQSGPLLPLQLPLASPPPLLLPLLLLLPLPAAHVEQGRHPYATPAAAAATRLLCQLVPLPPPRRLSFDSRPPRAPLPLALPFRASSSRTASRSCCSCGVRSLNVGRCAGEASQQAIMISARAGMQVGGSAGRRPFCTTPTAACRGVMSE